MSKHHLFLSPHYDDATYSCGGVIYSLVQAGDTVTILTIMAGEPQPPFPNTPVLQDNHTRWEAGENPVQVRRQEDKIAAQLLGVETQYLDILDCIYRIDGQTPLYPTEASLWHTTHAQDNTLGQLKATPLPKADVMYVPFGVGGHVDHLIVRDFGLHLAQVGYEVEFYIEYPYLRSEDTIQQAQDVFPLDIDITARAFSEDAMQHKIDAMIAYETQISSFWASQDSIASEVRGTFSAENGHFVERFAQLRTDGTP
ncbi:MAG: PIG-L family deacetylase [Chloroflexota bacterium]